MFRYFFSSKQGNFTLATAFLMAPLAAMAGLAFDFGNAMVLKRELQAAADDAVLATVTENADHLATRGALDGPVARHMEQDATRLFKAQIPRKPELALLSTRSSLHMEGTLLRASLQYEARVRSVFLRLIGEPSVTFAGSASADYATQVFRDFYVLVDNTPSMGVGATSADMARMKASLPGKCAIACHVARNGQADPADTYRTARDIGVTLRIDQVAQALPGLVDTALALRASADQFRLGLYSFGARAEDARLTEIMPIGGDLTGFRHRASTIELMSIPEEGFHLDQLTDFDAAFTAMDRLIGPQGSGLSATSPEKVLFLISDGVGDSRKPDGCTARLLGSTRCQEPIALALCRDLKSRGIRIAVLHTAYVPQPENTWYRTWIAPFQSQIGDHMRDCASDGLYREVRPDEDLPGAVKELFARAAVLPRLAG